MRETLELLRTEIARLRKENELLKTRVEVLKQTVTVLHEKHELRKILEARNALKAVSHE